MIEHVIICYVYDASSRDFYKPVQHRFDTKEEAMRFRASIAAKQHTEYVLSETPVPA